MITLNTLRPAKGSRKKKIRLGRGEASGKGGTSTKGHKGQKARSGVRLKRGFEGGQMPLIRRIPKRGFNNIFAKKPSVINLEQLQDWSKDVTVNVETLVAKGLVPKRNFGVKLLSRGDCTVGLTFQVVSASTAARNKVEAAGGKVEIVNV